MNGELAALPAVITVTLVEDQWSHTVFEPLRHAGPADEATRDYLREKSMVESMTARRLFAHDDC